MGSVPIISTESSFPRRFQNKVYFPLVTKRLPQNGGQLTWAQLDGKRPSTLARLFPGFSFHDSSELVFPTLTPSCKFHRASSIIRVPSCEFHRASSIGRVPLCKFHRASSFHHVQSPGSIVQILSCKSIVRVPLCEFHRVNFIVQISSCAKFIVYEFYCVNSIV